MGQERRDEQDRFALQKRPHKQRDIAETEEDLYHDRAARIRIEAGGSLALCRVCG